MWAAAALPAALGAPACTPSRAAGAGSGGERGRVCTRLRAALDLLVSADSAPCRPMQRNAGMQ